MAPSDSYAALALPLSCSAAAPRGRRTPTRSPRPPTPAPGSLRQAILDANANPGADTIAFNIPGSGVHTIAPLSGLPPVTEPDDHRRLHQPGSPARSRSGRLTILSERGPRASARAPAAHDPRRGLHQPADAVEPARQSGDDLLEGYFLAPIRRARSSRRRNGIILTPGRSGTRSAERTPASAT